ncbi:unnamed protein product [Dibothriocephalus latus]|uniref:NB-ARC domain-containing protein n=1 Tax=Dibothriocephalus latus TaxID=60516 RepID=A0A3P7QBA3_DIBLA|nr:unnamed protein product [Dibothriocephalus latus]
MAVREGLRKYLPPLDQSDFDVAFPELALKNPIVLYLDDSWMDNKLAIGQLLRTRTDLVTELVLWNGGPMHGEGVRSFLNEYVSMPFVNVVSVDFSVQCLNVADFFNYIGSHHFPKLRRLCLSLCHVQGWLRTTEIDREAGCFPRLDDVSVRFVEEWCCGCFSEVLKQLRNTVQLALVAVYLEFCLELIINRRGGGEALERSDFKEIFLKADAGISRLRCALGFTGSVLVEDIGTVARLKFLPLLEAQKNTLTSLDISTDLIIGCLKDQRALRQTVSLCGQLVNVRELVTRAGHAVDLRPFLEMLPSLTSLEVQNERIRPLNVDDFCSVFPCLRTLYCYSRDHEGNLRRSTGPPWKLETLHWSFGINFTPGHLAVLADSVQASFILLGLAHSRIAFQRENVVAAFARISS